MKIIVVGGTGTIGQAVVKELKRRHDIIVVASQHGDIKMDMTDVNSIQKMYQTVGAFDALVCTAGKVHFGDFKELTSKEHMIGINGKLMGQVNLVHLGLNTINPNGSFTLTSGLLSHDPIRFGSSASMVNAAIEGFVRGAAIEMPKSIRINVVSPTILEESFAEIGHFFYGYEPVPAARVAVTYSKSVEGLQTGQVYKVGW